MSPKPDTSGSSGFGGLGLIDELIAAVSALGYEEPTPVQRETIPLMIAQRDVLGQAATGTGKTAAFALPMLQRLAGDDASTKKQTGGLVLVPTRELSMQVAEAIHKYARGLGITVLPVYGGAPISQQIRTLERGAGIVVATPGRALDHIKRGTLKLGNLRMLVLDEADEMLDMGFAEDLDAILEATPKTRQTALFSATMPARILAIAQRHLRTPARVTIATEKTAAGKLPRVRQVAYVVPKAHKPAALDRVLDMENPTSALVFCRTRLEVETLVEPREHRLLRSVEAFTKQRIEVATVPTVAEVRAKRLDVTKASVRERILAGDLDDVRVVIESLAQEFDIVDIAAAAIKLAHAAEAGEETERDIPAIAVPAERPAREGRTSQRFSRGVVVGAAGASRLATRRDRK